MQVSDANLKKLLSRSLSETLIRLGLAAFLLVVSWRVFEPFAQLVLWALILAVALDPLHRQFAGRLGGHQGLSATILILACLILLGVPMAFLGESLLGTAKDTHAALESGAVAIKEPDPSVADWPIVGDRVYKTWSAAASDLPGYLEDHRAQIKELLDRVLTSAVGTAKAVLVFVGGLIVSGIMMAYGEAGSRAVRRIFCRFTNPADGVRLQALSTATIRSVATGVIGVALIQALLLGFGFYLAGVPAAGLLSLFVLLIGIAQIPALLISLPAVAYIWWAGDSSAAINVVWTVYLLLAGMADNVLKPLLLGRGVNAPMPVVLIGAIGGMVVAGIIGLFLGAVLLTVGYKVFMEWVDDRDTAATSESEDAGHTAQRSNRE
jgi:predicted PurR-regulated permease PerM